MLLYMPKCPRLEIIISENSYLKSLTNHEWSELHPIDRVQRQILKQIKARGRTEKELSKIIELESSVLSSIINDLMVFGYVEILSRRKLYFFRRKYCTITPAGFAALQQYASPMEKFVENVKDKALTALDSFFQISPSLRMIGISAHVAYKAYRLLD